MSNTPCSRKPECCQPRQIKAVFWDADDTMWKIEPYAIASSVHGPFNLIDPDTLEAEEGSSYSSPGAKEKTKKPYQPRLGSYDVEEWWKTHIGEIKDEEVRDISTELLGSLTPEDQKFITTIGHVTGKEVSVSKIPPVKKEEPVNIADIQGWSEAQKKSVEKLQNMYGQRGCQVLDVDKQSSSLTLKCNGDTWILHKDGSLSQVHKPRKGIEISTTPVTYAYSYQPRKITVKLLPTFRQTLDELEKRGITSSIISLNTPGSVNAIVKAFGMEDRFTEINDTWENKGKVYEDSLKRQKICGCNGLFVDNTVSHVEDVSRVCGLAVQIGKDKDIEKPIDILKYIQD